jgi:hypothetical protein
MPGLAAILAVASLVAATGASPPVLYKLIAKDGRITYSDRAPKNFEGQVIRLEPDTESNLVPSNRPPAPAAPAASGTSFGADRKANREALQKALRAAQDKVEAARQAKAEGTEPGPDEMQVVQRRYAPLKAGQDPPRSNCRNATDSTGKPYLLCAAQVPGDAFYERQKALDQALESALAELAEAERAYRRGAD